MPTAEHVPVGDDRHRAFAIRLLMVRLADLGIDAKCTRWALAHHDDPLVNESLNGLAATMFFACDQLSDTVGIGYTPDQEIELSVAHPGTAQNQLTQTLAVIRRRVEEMLEVTVAIQQLGFQPDISCLLTQIAVALREHDGDLARTMLLTRLLTKSRDVN